MTHPDSLAGADVSDVPDASLSPSDPAQLVTWLRALPAGTVLLDENEIAFQVWGSSSGGEIYPASRVPAVYRRGQDDDMRALCNLGPFRVIWSSGGQTV